MLINLGIDLRNDSPLHSAIFITTIIELETFMTHVLQIPFDKGIAQWHFHREEKRSFLHLKINTDIYPHLEEIEKHLKTTRVSQNDEVEDEITNTLTKIFDELKEGIERHFDEQQMPDDKVSVH